MDKLTPQQLAELRRLDEGSRISRGKGRVRVHNNLRRLDLAEIYHETFGFRARITEAGRALLAATPPDGGDNEGGTRA